MNNTTLLDLIPFMLEIHYTYGWNFDDDEPIHPGRFAFEHPERAVYIFGPENGHVSPECVALCQHIVYIPTNRCMNLAATVNVVLYDRMAKSKRSESKLQRKNNEA